MNLDQRLRALLAADVAGYSELMAADERSTVVALNAARQIFKEEIQSHHGLLVDTAGDSVLAVFDTAIGAAEAAVDVQKRLEWTNAAGVSARRLRFRIGVHLSDILVHPTALCTGKVSTLPRDCRRLRLQAVWSFPRRCMTRFGRRADGVSLTSEITPSRTSHIRSMPSR
jgi:hypothetical protein